MADRVTVGDAEIIAVIDMVPPPREPSAMFPDVPTDAWDPYLEEVLTDGQLQLYYGCFVIRSQGQVLLPLSGTQPAESVSFSLGSHGRYRLTSGMAMTMENQKARRVFNRSSWVPARGPLVARPAESQILPFCSSTKFWSSFR